MSDNPTGCPRCGGVNPDPHLHERTGRPCVGPGFPTWPAHLDEHGNPRPGAKPPGIAPNPTTPKRTKRKR